MESSTLGDESRRQRGPQACEACHHRKVRCDVGSNGPPCAACAANSADCIPRSRKAYRPRRRRRNPEPTPGVLNDPNAESHFHHAISGTPFPHEQTFPVAANSPATWNSSNSSTDLIQEKNRNDAVTLVDAVKGNASFSGDAAMFIGDKQGFGALLEVLNIEGAPQHYTIPRSSVNALDPDDLTYLKSKGCFSLPAQVICESLMQSYFHLVHPSLPIVDVKGVLGPNTKIGFQKINLLLLWSMFSVSASYIDLSTVHLAGYRTRKEMKEAFYKRAKCLYDNGYEEDRIALLQSAILMGFWFSGAEDRTASWHWTGVAISLAQTLGLHRGLGNNESSRISIAQQRLWRRIWWSCFFRDRWLSLGMGRPMRINAEDCDVALPSIDDVMDDVHNVAESVCEAYLPSDIAYLASRWLKLIDLSAILGEILARNYRPSKSRLTADEFGILEQKLALLGQDASPEPSGKIGKLSEKIFQLHKEAVLIVLFRPYTPENRSNPPVVLAARAKQRTSFAATNTNGILDAIIASDSVKYLGPMM